MSYKLAVTEPFEKEAKRLRRKYPSLKGELESLFKSLMETPTQGDALGKSCYKVRLAVKSKGKGKRGGARVTTHVHVTETRVYLLDIYDKSEQDTISEKELDALLELIND